MSMHRFLMCALLVSLAPAARAQEVTLCNDGFGAGDAVTFQAGFVLDEAAAVKIEAPPADGYPFTINKVQLLFGGEAEGDGFNVILRIFDDDGEDAFATPGFPGTQLYEQAEVGLLSSTDGVNEAILTTPHVVTAGAVWVAIFFQHDFAPSVANDNDGTIDGSRNAIFSQPTFSGWIDADTAGIAGDWIIRAVTDSPTASPDDACIFEGGAGEGEGEGKGGEGEGEGGEGEGEGGEGEGEGGALVITSVNPSSQVTGESVRVTIAGASFSDDTTFRIGAEQCSDVDVQNDGAALCNASAALQPGSYDVIAQSGAETFVFPSGFTVDAAGGCACASSSSPFATVTALGALLALRMLRRRRRQTDQAKFERDDGNAVGLGPAFVRSRELVAWRAR